MKNGPMETGFQVYEDFMSYRGGIYQYDPETSGRMMGGHAIKIVGWGEEEGVKYWTLANSWGPRWGEEGFFRMQIGDCGMNGQGAYACTPKL